jgi:hypothetical protein
MAEQDALSLLLSMHDVLPPSSAAAQRLVPLLLKRGAAAQDASVLDGVGLGSEVLASCDDDLLELVGRFTGDERGQLAREIARVRSGELTEASTATCVLLATAELTGRDETAWLLLTAPGPETCEALTGNVTAPVAVRVAAACLTDERLWDACEPDSDSSYDELRDRQERLHQRLLLGDAPGQLDELVTALCDPAGELPLEQLAEVLAQEHPPARGRPFDILAWVERLRAQAVPRLATDLRPRLGRLPNRESPRWSAPRPGLSAAAGDHLRELALTGAAPDAIARSEARWVRLFTDLKSDDPQRRGAEKAADDVLLLLVDTFAVLPADCDVAPLVARLREPDLTTAAHERLKAFPPAHELGFGPEQVRAERDLEVLRLVVAHGGAEAAREAIDQVVAHLRPASFAADGTRARDRAGELLGACPHATDEQLSELAYLGSAAAAVQQRVRAAAAGGEPAHPPLPEAPADAADALRWLLHGRPAYDGHGLRVRERLDDGRDRGELVAALAGDGAGPQACAALLRTGASVSELEGAVALTVELARRANEVLEGAFYDALLAFPIASYARRSPSRGHKSWWGPLTERAGEQLTDEEQWLRFAAMAADACGSDDTRTLGEVLDAALDDSTGR